MTAYWIATYLEIRDEAKLAAYAQIAGPALLDAGGKFLARSEAAISYEAGQKQRTVVIEFDSVDAAVAAHDGAAYQEALVVLGDAVTRDLRIVPGVE